MSYKFNTENPSVINAFRTMEYNEADAISHAEDFVASFGNMLSSVVNGELDAGKIPEVAFTFAEHEFKVNYIQPEFLKKSLLEKCSKTSAQDKPQERIEKLKSLVSKNESALCWAASIASGIPLWQIREYGLTTWKRNLESNKTGTEPSPSSGIVWLTARDNSGVPTTERLLTLLQSLCREEKIVILTTALYTYDIPEFLPMVHLIQAVNKAKIWEKPIDLLLLNGFSEETMLILSETQKEVLAWGQGTSETNSPRVQSALVSGVFCSRDKSVHYIIDSTADLVSGVDSIVTHKWRSGTNRSSACLLFIHESVQDKSLELFRSKLNNHQDFGNSGIVPGLGSELIQKEGIKTIPEDTDFSHPTLVYEIGTSSPWITGWLPRKGHLLFLIPFRSPTELISLVNNEGGLEKDVALFTSDQTLIRQFIGGVQARGIWLNSVPRQQDAETQNWSRLILTVPNSTSPDKNNYDWRPFLAETERGLKNWSSVGTQARWEKVVSAFLTATHAQGKETESMRHLEDLMSVAIGNKCKGSGLIAYHHKPHGVVGILLLNTGSERSSRSVTTLLPILMAVGNGNAVLVISVGHAHASIQDFINLETTKNSFPTGLIQSIQVKSLQEGLAGLSKEGKVPLVWIIHSGGSFPGITRGDIPDNAFSCILVDDVSTLPSTVRSRGNLLDVTTAVYL